MAHTVSGASLEGIYNRLNGIEQHHPLEADTFADWSVEAGDVVTISRDGKSYQSPIHTSTMKWQGKTPMVSVSSTGNEKREPISKVSRQKYSRGGSGGYRSNRSFYNEIWSEDGYLHSVLSQTESNFHVYVEDTYAQLRSGLELTSSSARLYVDNAYARLRSGLKLTSSSARLYASSAENAAQIVARINASTGESEIQLDANKVYIGNQRSTTVINGKLNASDLTAEYLKTKLANVQGLSVGTIYSTDYQLNIGGRYATIGNGFERAYISRNGDTYTLNLFKFDGTAYTPPSGYSLSFSRATTLRGEWSGGVYTVTASPQGNGNTTTLAGHLMNGTWDESNKLYTGYVAYVVGENYMSTGRSVIVDATAAYNAGAASIVTEERTVNLGTGSGNLEINPSDGYNAMTKVTVRRTRYSLKCTDAVSQSGNVTYTFQVQLSSGSFSKNTTYYFYR